MKHLRGLLVILRRTWAWSRPRICYYCGKFSWVTLETADDYDEPSPVNICFKCDSRINRQY
jgi:hypothetical protein